VIPQPAVEPSEILISTIRHGLTELNRSQRTGGRTDAPLIEEGRRQAQEACATFAGTPFDVAYSSSLVRALETARIVANIEPPRLLIDDLCTERSFGQMEGLTRAQIVEKLPQVVYKPIGHVHYSMNPPGGESFDELHARAQQFVEKILAQHRGQRVLVFSHQNFLQQFHGVMLGLDPMRSLERDILNCELNQFHLDRDSKLLAFQTFQLCSDASRFPSF
jgi:probable phosphoglycerate mutase